MKKPLEDTFVKESQSFYILLCQINTRLQNAYHHESTEDKTTFSQKKKNRMCPGPSPRIPHNTTMTMPPHDSVSG